MKLEKGQTTKKDLPIETKDLGERMVQFTISKEVVDRDGDILRAGGGSVTTTYVRASNNDLILW